MANTKLQLLRPVTIAGEDHAQGDTLTVPADTAAWLIEQQAAEPATSTKSSRAKSAAKAEDAEDGKAAA